LSTLVTNASRGATIFRFRRGIFRYNRLITSPIHQRDPSGITQILHAVAQGDRAAEPRLLELVYAELHGLAAGYMRRERRDHTLQASALVNEAYLRLIGNGPISFESRAHFYVTAAQTMRRILIDHARKKQSAKRDGAMHRVEMNEAMLLVDQHPHRFLDLDAALLRLSEMDARQTRIVELRFFAGLSVEETAKILGISEKTVKRDWSMARAWLENQLADSQ
jgi:RNA polymerase sigma-70 factor (ECF subfamily)